MDKNGTLYLEQQITENLYFALIQLLQETLTASNRLHVTFLKALRIRILWTKCSVGKYYLISWIKLKELKVDATHIIWITNLFDIFRIKIAQQQEFRFAVFRCHAIQLIHVVIVHAKYEIVFFKVGRFDLFEFGKCYSHLIFSGMEIFALTCLALLLYAKLCFFIVANARLSGLRPTCHEPIAALSISHSSATPAVFTSSINTASAIGERQILPADQKGNKSNDFHFCIKSTLT